MFEAKRMLGIDHQQMNTFESICGSKKWSSILFDEWDKWRLHNIVGLMFDFCLYIAKK